MNRILISATLCAGLLFSLPALAAEAFTKAAFTQAQEAGSDILLHVHAPWCPTCKAQEPSVSMLEHDNPALKVFRIDFDSQKDVLNELKVRSQSTLIAFKGKTETSRMTGVTDPKAIAAMVAPSGMMK